LAGVLDAVAGVLVGSFSDLRDNTQAHGQFTDNPFGSSVEDIIRSHVPANKAIHWNLPVGHGARNVSVVLGASWAQQKHHFAL
jgi:muramoyltetrapeptide carboxypeptidase LdcA involved in peptidoglycan recycling